MTFSETLRVIIHVGAAGGVFDRVNVVAPYLADEILFGKISPMTRRLMSPVRTFETPRVSTSRAMRRPFHPDAGNIEYCDTRLMSPTRYTG